jgi:hypothetical protein
MFENLKPGDKVYIVPTEAETCSHCLHESEPDCYFFPSEVEITRQNMGGDLCFDVFGEEYNISPNGWIYCDDEKRGMAFFSKEDYENYKNIRNEIKGLLMYLDNREQFIKTLRKNTPDERLKVLYMLQNIVQIIKPGSIPFWRDK